MITLDDGTQAVIAGHDANRSGEPLSSNPHKVGPDANLMENCWARGWGESQKDGKFNTIPKKEAGS